MAFEAAVGKAMEAVAHDQQVKAPPGRLRRLGAISVIDLPTKLTDDPLNDVGHP